MTQNLSEVKDELGLAHAVMELGSAMDAAHVADEDVNRLVAEELAKAGPTLLVLDNFEQLVCTARVVREWCQVAPELSVLVTSRERLAVEGEVVVEVEPLACPRPGDSDADVLGCEAVRLLAARAAAAGGALGAEAPVLGGIVRQLDGIPLAIELAAARIRLMRPKELLMRLAKPGGLGESVRNPGDGGPRHRTLSSAIDWSWNLLPRPEQVVLAQCAVFAGGFTLEAAEAVVALLAHDAVPVVERIAALRDKSLVRVSGEDGRLGLLLSIREYATRKLEEQGAEEAAILRARHARHYASSVMAFNRSRTYQGAEPDAAMRKALTRDKENLGAALAFLSVPTSPESPTTRRSTPSLRWGLRSCRRLRNRGPCRDTVTLALERAATGVDGGLKARLLLCRQGLLNGMGRFAESRDDLRALLAIVDDAPGMRVLATVMKGIQLRYQGLYREARESHVRARPSSRGSRPRLRAMNAACMGRLEHDRECLSEARAYNDTARTLAAEIADEWLVAVPVANLAVLDHEEQNFARASELLAEAIGRFQEASEPQYVALYTAALGDVYFEWGNPCVDRRPSPVLHTRARARTGRSRGGAHDRDDPRGRLLAGLTLYPQTKVSAQRAVDMIEKYGPERICVAGACDWGPSDPIAVPRFILEMRRRRLSEDLIARVVFENPVSFLSQSGKFHLRPRAGEPAIAAR